MEKIGLAISHFFFNYLFEKYIFTSYKDKQTNFLGVKTIVQNILDLWNRRNDNILANL